MARERGSRKHRGSTEEAPKHDLKQALRKIKFTNYVVRQSNAAGNQQHNLDSAALHLTRMHMHSSSICIAVNDAVLPYGLGFYGKKTRCCFVSLFDIVFHIDRILSNK